MTGPTSTPSRPFTLSRIQGFINHVYKSKFVRNVAVVASGAAGAQAIGMAFAPIITRLYGPEEFGILGTFMAIAALVTPIAALSYPIAIVLPKKDSDARGIARLSAFIAFGVASIMTLVLIISGDRIVELLHVQSINTYVLLIPLVVVFAAWLQINQQWLIRKKQFKITAKVDVIQAFLINSAKSSIGLFKPVAAVLIVIATMGSALHAFMLSWGAKKAEESKDNERSRSKLSLWDLAKKHYDFPLYRAPQMFINAVSQSLPILMLAAFFGTASVGFYVLCIKFLGMPLKLIGKSVGDVFYPRITEAVHSGENMTKLILEATMGLAVIGLLPFAIVIFFGPWLFEFVFGSEWLMAGEYARWLAVWMFFMFINRPSVVAVPVLGLQKGFLLYEILSSGSKFIAIYIVATFFADDKLAIAIFSILGAIAYIFLIGWVIISSLFFGKVRISS